MHLKIRRCGTSVIRTWQGSPLSLGHGRDALWVTHYVEGTEI